MLYTFRVSTGYIAGNSDELSQTFSSWMEEETTYRADLSNRQYRQRETGSSH
jgi:hypothetical protein